MRKIVVVINLTLDGVMQAPGRPDEDTRDGFEHGGWATPFAAMSDAGDSMTNMGALLLGRWTYESFHAFWPKQTDSPFTAMLNNLQKFVASTTLDAASWSNTTLLKGDAAKAVANLKKEPGRDIVIFGSGKLVQSLMPHNVIDEYVLLIHPLILGSGRRLFADGEFTSLKLLNAKTTTKGVVIATYQPATSAA